MLLLLAQFISVPLTFFGPNQAHGQTLPTTPGWTPLANTKIANICAGNNGFPGVLGGTGCSAILNWSGAAFDTTRNRMIITGGGHNDYYGNELYALNLANLTLTRLNDPGLPPASSCTEAIAGGMQPNSRHTYDGIEYMANVDRLFVFSGSLSCGAGNFGQWVWTYNFGTNQWQSMEPTNGTKPVGDAGMLTAYDPNTGLIFLHDRKALHSYNFSTNTWTRLSTEYRPLGYHLAATIDPVRKRFVIVGYDSAAGGGRVYSYDIGPGSNYTIQTHNTGGGSAIVGDIYPGLDYDPVSDRIVAYGGGDTVYSLNLSTNTWTTATYSGGPGPAHETGTHGRWRYSAVSGIFIAINSASSNAYAFRITAGTGGGGDTTAPTVPTGLTANPISAAQVSLNWNASTDGVGVTGYRLFRNNSQIATPTGTSYTDTGLSASTTYTYTVAAIDAAGNASTQSTGVLATTQSAGSGSADFQARCGAAGVLVCKGFDSAADFTIATWPNSGLYRNNNNEIRGTMDASIKTSGNGSLRFEIASNSPPDVAGYWRQDSGQQFGQNSTFYVQFRQRFSPEMLTNDWTGAMGTWWKQVIFHGAASTCADVELTTVNVYTAGLPYMYTDCGSRGIVTNGGVPPYLLQQGDYNCPYGNTSGSNCYRYTSNEWITFYYRIHIGTWGSANSTIEAWVAPDGQPIKKWINMPNFTLFNDGPGPNYSHVTLTPYMTGKNTSVSHPTAYTWYDELIISTQPIAAPSGSASNNPPPSPPTNLRVQ
jgi:hypothetical protein